MFQYPIQHNIIDEIHFAIFIIFALGFIGQMYYHWVYFSRLAFFREKRKIKDEQPVSIVVCARDEYENLRKNLPLMLEQDYPYFEVVVVNDTSSDDTKDLLRMFSKKYGNLKVFDLEQNLNFFKGKKFPLALGIKSATYDIVLLTDADCQPTSKNWIRKMQANYDEKTEIVLGYGAYKKEGGLLNSFIRFDTLHIAIQYLSLSLAGKTYMGVGRNLSYRKLVFNRQKGFSSHYKLMSGDDDLFINSVATKQNTRIEIDKDSHSVSKAKGSFSDWFSQKRRHFSTAKHYKRKVRRTLQYYGLTKFMTYLFFILLAILSYNLIFAGGALLLYFISLLIIFYKSSRRLDEYDLFWISPILDILMCFLNPFIYLSNLIAKQDKWK